MSNRKKVLIIIMMACACSYTAIRGNVTVSVVLFLASLILTIFYPKENNMNKNVQQRVTELELKLEEVTGCLAAIRKDFNFEKKVNND